MEILFIDESEVNKKSKNDCFILGGLSISEEKLILLEENLDSLKAEFRVKNFKEFRDTTKIKREEKLVITKKIVSILRDSNVLVTSIIFGDLGKDYWKNYSNAIYFILERFFLRLKKANKKGLVVCDSLSNKQEKLISTKIIRELKEIDVILKGDNKGTISTQVYPCLFFQDDNCSSILQVTDLICASLQQAVTEFKASNPNVTIKRNEHLLKELSPYLRLYWNLFEKGPFGIAGWGIKVWD